MANHPEKHPEMITRSEQPLNAEAPLYLLPRNFTTPTELFYIRNHGSIPEGIRIDITSPLPVWCSNKCVFR
jgi:hypothetical protein